MRNICKKKTANKLNGKASPTLFVGRSEGLEHGSAKKKMLVRKCCIRDCMTRSPPDRLHCFPTEPQLRKEWIKLCRPKDGIKWHFICARHFRPSLLPNKNSKLPKQAFPELNLGIDTKDPLECGSQSAKCLRGESEDVGIDEDNSKGTDGIGREAESCPNCQATKSLSEDMQQQLAAARLKIEKLKLRLKNHEYTEEEEEYIFMLMK
ncbi:uncharacterized protein LOC111069922 [Drosophila obscura]|uniref:uncharacterized protein LOC111069922 n=1 Tax=Drosophila obscura TaxID=7282 RepID=UPI000BA01974|nr:uncharacterized protein LOC111069922 [Drosophila obscura]